MMKFKVIPSWRSLNGNKPLIDLTDPKAMKRYQENRQAQLRASEKAIKAYNPHYQILDQERS